MLQKIQTNKRELNNLRRLNEQYQFDIEKDKAKLNQIEKKLALSINGYKILGIDQ